MQGLFNRQKLFITRLLDRRKFANGATYNQRNAWTIKSIVKVRNFKTSCWLKKNKEGKSSRNDYIVAKIKNGKTIFRVTRKSLTRVHPLETKDKISDSPGCPIIKVKGPKYIESRTYNADVESPLGVSKQPVDKLSSPRFRDTSVVNLGQRTSLMGIKSKKCRSVETRGVKNINCRRSKPSDESRTVSSQTINLCQEPICLRGPNIFPNLRENRMEAISSGDKDPRDVSSKTLKRAIRPRSKHLIFSSLEMLYPNVKTLEMISSNSPKPDKLIENDGLAKEEGGWRKGTESCREITIKSSDRSDEPIMKVLKENISSNVAKSVQRFIKNSKEIGNLTLEGTVYAGMKDPPHVNGHAFRNSCKLNSDITNNHDRNLSGSGIKTEVELSAKEKGIKNRKTVNDCLDTSVPVNNLATLSSLGVHTVKQGDNVTLHKHIGLKRSKKYGKTGFDKMTIDRVSKLEGENCNRLISEKANVIVSDDVGVLKTKMRVGRIDEGIKNGHCLGSKKTHELRMGRVIIPDDGRNIRDCKTEYGPLVKGVGGTEFISQEGNTTDPFDAGRKPSYNMDKTPFVSTHKIAVDKVVTPEDGSTIHPNTTGDFSTLSGIKVPVEGCQSQAARDEPPQKNVNQVHGNSSLVNQYDEARIGRINHASINTSREAAMNRKPHVNSTGRVQRGNQIELLQNNVDPNADTKNKSTREIFSSTKTNDNVSHEKGKTWNNISNKSTRFNPVTKLKFETDAFSDNIVHNSSKKGLGSSVSNYRATIQTREMFPIVEPVHSIFETSSKKTENGYAGFLSGNDGNVLNRKVTKTQVFPHSGRNVLETTSFKSHLISEGGRNKSSTISFDGKNLKEKGETNLSVEPKTDNFTSIVFKTRLSNVSQPSVQDPKTSDEDTLKNVKQNSLVDPKSVSTKNQTNFDNTDSGGVSSNESFSSSYSNSLQSSAVGHISFESTISGQTEACSPKLAGTSSKTGLLPPCNVDSIIKHVQNICLSDGCNTKSVFPPLCSSCGNPNFRGFQNHSENCTPTCKPPFPPPCQSECTPPSNTCEPETVTKSKTHSILDVDAMPKPPIPICIDCIPKSKPCFPPKCPKTLSANSCQPVDSDKMNVSYLWWLQKTSRTCVRSTYYTIKGLMRDILDKFIALLRARVFEISFDRMQKVLNRKSLCSPSSTLNVIQSSVIRPNKDGVLFPRSTIKNRDCSPKCSQTIQLTANKKMVKTKIRVVKTVRKNVHDELSRRAVLEEEVKRKATIAKFNPPPALSYSEVLNIVFNQKK